MISASEYESDFDILSKTMLNYQLDEALQLSHTIGEICNGKNTAVVVLAFLSQLIIINRKAESSEGGVLKQ